MAKNTGKVREFCQSGKVGTLFFEQDIPPSEWTIVKFMWLNYHLYSE